MNQYAPIMQHHWRKWVSAEHSPNIPPDCDAPTISVNGWMTYATQDLHLRGHRGGMAAFCLEIDTYNGYWQVSKELELTLPDGDEDRRIAVLLEKISDPTIIGTATPTPGIFLPSNLPRRPAVLIGKFLLPDFANGASDYALAARLEGELLIGRQEMSSSIKAKIILRNPVTIEVEP